MNENRTSPLTVVIAVFLIGFLVLCCVGLWNSENAKPSPEAVRAVLASRNSKLKFGGELNRERGFVVGYVTNSDSTPFARVYIEFQKFDKEGAQLGITADAVEDLSAFGVWKFRCYAPDAARLQLKELIGR